MWLPHCSVAECEGGWFLGKVQVRGEMVIRVGGMESMGSVSGWKSRFGPL